MFQTPVTYMCIASISNKPFVSLCLQNTANGNFYRHFSARMKRAFQGQRVYFEKSIAT